MLRPDPLSRIPPTSRNSARLRSASACFGEAPVAAPVVVSFEATVNPAGVEQPACTLCGDCCSGCNVGAKNTVAMTYLPDAKAHGAEIFTELSVSRVEKVDGHWRVHFAPTEGARRRASASVEAKTVVLAAGTLGSTEILLRSRAAWAGDLRPSRRALLGQWRHHRLCARRRGPRERHRRRPPAEIRRRRHRRLRDRRDRA